MQSRILRWLLQALNVTLRFRVGRWLVGGLVKVLLAVALVPVSRFVAALMGPLFRSFPITRESVARLFEHVATLYKGGQPVYADADGHTADEIEELATSLAEIFVVLRAHYKFEIEDADLAKLLEAVGVRLLTP